MRQRVATPLLRIGPPQWSGDPHFDLGYHVRRVRACEPTIDAVLDIARQSAMAGFDRARPLWEYTLVEGLEDDRAAMVLKVHHSMTDGVGGMKLLLMLFDFEREPEPAPPLDRVDAVPVFEPLDLVFGAIGHRRRRAMGIARRSVVEAVGVGTALVEDPVGTLQAAARAAGSVIRLLAPATVPRSPLLTARTLARNLSTIEIPLDDLKRATKSVGGSLNDAFVASVIGGMQRYHEFHGMPVDELRMVMPISVRGATTPPSAGTTSPRRGSSCRSGSRTRPSGSWRWAR
jgi:WS/DGAT/MGAT family acyltransferase